MNFANMNAIIVAINPISPFKTGQNQVNLAISSIVVYMFKGSIVEKVNNPPIERSIEGFCFSK